MQITMENVCKLVRDFGRVDIVDSTGKTQRLRDGSPDVWALIEKAERFRFAGSTYDRAGFEKVLDRHIGRPGNVAQINLPEPPPPNKPDP
jgi:hypothetical protein